MSIICFYTDPAETVLSYRPQLWRQLSLSVLVPMSVSLAEFTKRLHVCSDDHSASPDSSALGLGGFCRRQKNSYLADDTLRALGKHSAGEICFPWSSEVLFQQLFDLSWEFTLFLTFPGWWEHMGSGKPPSFYLLTVFSF